MNKYNQLIDELEVSLERLKHKVKQSKILCKNNTDGSDKIVFAHNLYGAGKIVGYELSIFGKNPVNIVVKLDNVVVTTTTGVLLNGEILLKAHKLYSLVVECTGEGMLAGKLKLESAELKVI